MKSAIFVPALLVRSFCRHASTEAESGSPGPTRRLVERSALILGSGSPEGPDVKNRMLMGLGDNLHKKLRSWPALGDNQRLRADLRGLHGDESAQAAQRVVRPCRAMKFPTQHG